MRIYFMGMPFFMLYNYGAAILRAVGDTKRPLVFPDCYPALVNAVLNMILVIVFHMDVAGVAHCHSDFPDDFLCTGIRLSGALGRVVTACAFRNCGSKVFT